MEVKGTVNLSVLVMLFEQSGGMWCDVSAAMLHESPVRLSAHMLRIGFARSRVFPCVPNAIFKRVQPLDVYGQRPTPALPCRR